MYVILGATGNIGSVIATSLLAKGEKIRVVGRNACRLDKYVRKGAEAIAMDITDAGALTEALAGARAAFLMLPPNMTSPDYRAEQERISDAIAEAAEASGLQYAVHLSSIGAQAASGTGPIVGAHNSEKKLNALEDLSVLHLRPAYFMENNLAGIALIQTMGIFGSALLPDLKIPMIATRDIGAYAAERLLALDFSGSSTQELLGPRDISMNEVTSIIGRGLGKPDLRYMQFPYDQIEQVLVQMGTPAKSAGQFAELFKGINEGIVTNEEPRSAANTTPTSFETFVQDILAPAYRGSAATA
ncbi:MAG TPA: NAD(P)H-binding protein [Candidatus Acidoferrum sp.]|jgi:uncharacterized protein YbjT (DUF2867 family)